MTLEDGTELVTSGDHRFLTDRGWKHVSDNAKCPQRAHLTTNNKLMGVGAFAEPPIRSAPYREGYLCGLIRGDGHIGTYRYRRPNRSRDEHHRFRLALTDFEALRRAREYLRRWGVETQQFTFAEATATTRRAVAIRTSPAGAVATVRQATRWPDRLGLLATDRAQVAALLLSPPGGTTAASGGEAGRGAAVRSSARWQAREGPWLAFRRGRRGRGARGSSGPPGRPGGPSRSLPETSQPDR